MIEGISGDEAIDPGAPPTCGGFGAAAPAAGMATPAPIPAPAFIDILLREDEDLRLCFDIIIL